MVAGQKSCQILLILSKRSCSQRPMLCAEDSARYSTQKRISNTPCSVLSVVSTKNEERPIPIRPAHGHTRTFLRTG